MYRHEALVVKSVQTQTSDVISAAMAGLRSKEALLLGGCLRASQSTSNSERCVEYVPEVIRFISKLSRGGVEDPCVIGGCWLRIRSVWIGNERIRL